jgi:hypothetical protein
MNGSCQVAVKRKPLFDGVFRQGSGLIGRKIGEEIGASKGIEYTAQKCYLCKGPMCSNPLALIAPTVGGPEFLGGGG